VNQTTRVYLSDAAYLDLVQLEEFLRSANDPLSSGFLEFILDALQVLSHQPAIGRPVEGGLRELIISRNRTGYLARYDLDNRRNLVRVARIRHQKESGYWPEDL
jgi:plasmid stabilization system protein ParE